MKAWAALSRRVCITTLTLLSIVGVLDCSKADAAYIYVTTTADKISSTGGCSLKEAIYSANFDLPIAIDQVLSGGIDHFIPTQCVPGVGNDTIVLPSGQTFFLSQLTDDQHNPAGPTATPIVFTNVTIEGNGSTLQWPGTIGRAFTVGAATINISNGPVANFITGVGHLTLRHTYVRGFLAKGGNGAGGGGGGLGAGGAIYVMSPGTLTVDGSTFEGNRAVGGNGSTRTNTGGGGGGMGGSGAATGGAEGGGGGGGARGNGAPGRFFPDVEAPGGGGGGTVRDAHLGDGGETCGGGGGYLSHNAGFDACAGGGGGGGQAVGPGIGGANPAGNGGNGGYGGGGGGGGFNGSSGSDGGNGGFGGGGGSGAGQGNLTGFGPYGGNGGFGAGAGASPSGFVEGGPGDAGLFGGGATETSGGAGAGLGGAIFNEGGTVVVRNSTFSGNSVSHGFLSGGSPASDGGGAIFSLNGAVTVLNSTIAGNESTGSAGAILVLQFGGFNQPPPPTWFELRNTIISNNGDQACAVSSTATISGSGNLIQANVNCPVVVSTDDPQLSPLALNGGLTPTMAIAATSPALDAGDGSTSLLTDQRGVDRPQLSGFDIGAYERCPPPLSPLFGSGCVSLQEQPIAETELLTTLVSPPASGTVTPATGNFLVNSVQALTATPTPSYMFVNWTGDVADPSSPSTFVVMNQPQTVTANFATCLTNLSGRGTAGNSLYPPRVDLTWTAAPGVDHVDVYRGAASGGPYTLVGSSTTTSFSDRTAGLVNNTKYYYVLQLFASVVNVCSSNELGVLIPKGR